MSEHIWEREAERRAGGDRLEELGRLVGAVPAVTPPAPCEDCGAGGGLAGAVGRILLAGAALCSFHWVLAASTQTVLGLVASGAFLTSLPRRLAGRRGG